MKTIVTLYATVMLIQFVLANTIEEKKSRYVEITAGEYHLRFLEAIESGKLDPPEESVPNEIRNEPRSRMYYQAGFLRGVQSYQTVSGLRKSEGIRPCMMPSGVFRWELEGFIKGCEKARTVGTVIEAEIDQALSKELQKDDATPESALDNAISIIERHRAALEQAEQPVASQSAIKPADKEPHKVQPPTPTAKDLPR